MSVDDDLFAPILPNIEATVRELIRRVMTGITTNITTTSNEITEIFYRYGIHSEQEITERVQQIIKDLTEQTK
jgi:hypothetical protein